MAKERRPLGCKVVAITGGARGIGKATAAAFVRKGCRVAIGDLDLALAEQTAAELGGGTIALPLDVTERDSFASFLDVAERELGPLDVLVNNAGIMPVAPLVEEPDDSDDPAGSEDEEEPDPSAFEPDTIESHVDPESADVIGGCSVPGAPTGGAAGALAGLGWLTVGQTGHSAVRPTCAGVDGIIGTGCGARGCRRTLSVPQDPPIA